jgi:hypothetical protein
LVAAASAVVNGYAFYVRGTKIGVERARLGELISRWLFGTLLTARYSFSPESVFEKDLGRIREVKAPEDFATALDRTLADEMTGEYWTRTLIDDLGTAKSRAPAALAFRAAQVVLGARAMFSDHLMQSLLSRPPEAGRSASEMHHLFPREWLLKNEVSDRRHVNQVANLADIDWPDNPTIGGDKGPKDYVPRLRETLRISDHAWGRMCAEHALPPGWENMDYDSFLQARRPRMAELIRVAYRKLGGEEEALASAPPWFFPGADVVWKQIAEIERALRGMVRETYRKLYGTGAAQKIQEALPEKERETLSRALRARPEGPDPLSVVDYLYLGQLPTLLFAGPAWQEARTRLGAAQDAKQKLQAAIGHIAAVRNEIADVREVEQQRLQRASVACNEILGMLRASL